MAVLSPAALALLSGIACLGTSRQAARAEDAALRLIERGIPRPGWAEHVGAVVAADCHVNSDPFGDRDEAVCEFSYAGAEPHASGQGGGAHTPSEWFHPEGREFGLQRILLTICLLRSEQFQAAGTRG